MFKKNYRNCTKSFKIIALIKGLMPQARHLNLNKTKQGLAPIQG